MPDVTDDRSQPQGTTVGDAFRTPEHCGRTLEADFGFDLTELAALNRLLTGSVGPDISDDITTLMKKLGVNRFEDLMVFAPEDIEVAVTGGNLTSLQTPAVKKRLDFIVQYARLGEPFDWVARWRTSSKL